MKCIVTHDDVTFYGELKWEPLKALMFALDKKWGARFLSSKNVYIKSEEEYEEYKRQNDL